MSMAWHESCSVHSTESYLAHGFSMISLCWHKSYHG